MQHAEEPEARREATAPAPNERQARTWAMLCHLSALLVLLGIPFGNILGPLGIWLWKRNDYPLVDEHGKESLNFQITMTIYFFLSLLLVIVAIGVLLLLALALAEVVLVIVAAVRASNGEPFRYPLTLRLIR